MGQDGDTVCRESKGYSHVAKYHSLWLLHVKRPLCLVAEETGIGTRRKWDTARKVMLRKGAG